MKKSVTENPPALSIATKSVVVRGIELWFEKITTLGSGTVACPHLLESQLLVPNAN